MAQAVVELFVDHLWRPSSHDAGDPAAWEALTDAVERLRPLAAASVASLFGVALGQREPSWPPSASSSPHGRRPRLDGSAARAG